MEIKWSEMMSRKVAVLSCNIKRVNIFSEILMSFNTVYLRIAVKGSMIFDPKMFGPKTFDP